MSFDIECLSEKGFPKADKDRVITIGIVCKTCFKPGNTRKIVFQLDSCELINGADVFQFEEERFLLEAFDNFVHCYDPDFITGYNIIEFDLKYLINRYSNLLGGNVHWSRYKHIPTQVIQSKYQSKLMGFRSRSLINLEGRIQFDMMIYMIKNAKLRSYSLNYVSYHFLNQSKEDVNHYTMRKLQKGTARNRKRIATYCLKDAVLPLNLFEN